MNHKNNRNAQGALELLVLLAGVIIVVTIIGLFLKGMATDIGGGIFDQGTNPQPTTNPNCGNGSCEPGLGEDSTNCPGDCSATPQSSCGNGECDPGESFNTCESDCPFFADVDVSHSGFDVTVEFDLGTFGSLAATENKSSFASFAGPNESAAKISDLKIDWGDSTTTNYSSPNKNFKAQHSYEQAGTYSITIYAYDRGQCIGILTKPATVSQFCGNNEIEGTEVCDGTALGQQTCVTQGFNGGQLACNAECTGFSTSNCNNCLNGVPDGSCDDMEISATCSDCQILILNVKPAASPGIGKTIELLVSLGNLSTPTGSTKIDWGDNTNETVPYLPIKKTHNYTGDVITPKTISVVVYNNQSKPIARGTILSWEK